MKLLLMLVAVICGVESLTSRFRSLNCTSLNESIVFQNCYIKPYSRNYSTVNFAFTHKLPFVAPLKVNENFRSWFVKNLMSFWCSQFNITIKYRYGTIFRPIFHTEIDWCDIVGQVNGNKVAIKMASLLKESLPDIFKPCPRPPVNEIILYFIF